MMNTLLKKFPREIAFPKRQYVQTAKEFIKLVNAYNGKKNIYFSLYNCCDKSEYNGGIASNFENAIIDKVFFDLDGDTLEKPFEDLKKLIAYCQKRKYKFCMMFSGKKGFHFYIFCKEVKNRNLLKNCQEYLMKILNINVDRHIIGDTARISRMPNTWHLTGERYCINLSIDDVKQGIEFIRKKAEQPNPEFFVYGEELLDLTTLPNIERETKTNGELPDFDYNKILDVKDDLIKDFPPCVQSWLTTYENSIHRNRFLFALYCAHSGLSPEECNSLAKKYYGTMKERMGRRTRYQEFRSEKAIEYAYGKDFILPNCNKLFQEGACLGKCKYYRKNTFYLYKDLNGGAK